ncbi:MAG TPA: ABC transporter ATP-binding protein [Chloroflexota bacterium]|nr:ABC transporter ATP-binding protein [Chloroflexota bacterium]
MPILDHDATVLRLDRVTLQLGGREVLREVSLDLRAGEFVGLIGANGAGKTTLLRVILGLLRPGSGTVEVLGRPLRRGNRAVGYVPQKQQLDPDTPLRGRDLVGLGIDGHRWGVPFPSAKRRARIEEALRAVDAAHYADAPVGRLSGGEQQRLLIAQALLAEPKILLLDEPLANLDIRSANEVVRLVARIGRERGVSVLLVAHDMNPLMEVMDTVVYLAEGRAAVGPVAEVVRTEVLSRLYGYPVDVLHVRGRILVLGGSEVLMGGHADHEVHAHG